jgi:23S rRNA (cytosine1962-C5)-methyltransferase
MIRTAKSWRDFEIIATGGGEKLERWGSVYLLRPDPQAIWSPSFNLAEFDGLNAHYLRSSAGGGKWNTLKKFPDEWTIGWGNLKFLISPTNFKHTGLFPEQAVNWETIGALCRAYPFSDTQGEQGKRSSNGYALRKAPEILNLFGYTGGATVACAAAGANVTHVDASAGMTAVCKRNCEQNGIKNVRFIVDDCHKFVLRESRRGKAYDAIIMDPPSFGRGTNGEVWKIETDIENLVMDCVKILSKKPLFFLINSYTTGLQPTVIKNILQRCLEKHKTCATIDAYEIGIPTRENIDLPAGSSAIATFK